MIIPFTTRLDDFDMSGYFKKAWHKILPPNTAEAESKESLLVSASEQPDRGDRFIAYDNGTVLDTKTKLMWAARGQW